MRILITGGGTGGHLFPGLCVAQEVHKRYTQSAILFVGSKERIESKVVPQKGFMFKSVATFQMRKKYALRNILFPLVTGWGMLQALWHIISFKPDVILGLGGYISVSSVIGGFLFRVPSVLHEQNFSPGRANNFLAFFAKRIAVSFESSLRFFPQSKGVFTGNFVRDIILEKQDKGKSREKLGLDTDKFTFLVTGGSLGARSVNNIVKDAIVYLKGKGLEDKFQIIHLSGKSDRLQLIKFYEDNGIKNYTESFSDDMGTVYSATDLVIARAGGTTIAEIVCRGLASFLIPYPYAVNDHQAENARFLQRHGASYIMDESEISGEKMGNKMEEAIADSSMVEDMADKSVQLYKRDALDEMMKVIEGVI